MPDHTRKMDCRFGCAGAAVEGILPQRFQREESTQNSVLLHVVGYQFICLVRLDAALQALLQQAAVCKRRALAGYQHQFQLVYWFQMFSLTWMRPRRRCSSRRPSASAAWPPGAR